MLRLRVIGLFALSLMAAASVPPAAGAAEPYGTPNPPSNFPGAKPATPWMEGAAVELVVNGGFEGGLAGWTFLSGGGGLWYASPGTSSPLNGFNIPGPAEGTLQAVTDMVGPGTNLLYQDVTIPSGATATLNLVLWYSNQAGVFFNPPTLNYLGEPNQQLRIDILSPAAPVDDVGAGVLQNVFRTLPGDPLVLGYTPVTANLDAFAGQTIRLRIAEVDNQFYFNVGIDAVSIQAEPIVPAAATTWGGIKGLYR